MDKANRKIEREMKLEPSRADLTHRFALTQRRSNNLRELFAPWLKSLSSSSMTVQKRVLRRLEELGQLADFAAESILICLPSFHSQVSKIALPILRNFGAAAIPALTSILQRNELRTRRLALRELVHLGPKAEPMLPVLMDCVNASQTSIRILALRAFASAGAASPLALPFLTKTLNHPCAATRRAACAQFKNLKQQAVEAVAILSTILKDDADVWMRCEAARGLASLAKHAPIQTDFLFEMLNQHELHWDRTINIQIIEILQQTGPQTVVPLVSLLTNSPYYHRRLIALSALLIYGPLLEEHLPTLLKSYERESDSSLRVYFLDLFRSHPRSALLKSHYNEFLLGFASGDPGIREASFKLCKAIHKSSDESHRKDDLETIDLVKSAFIVEAQTLLSLEQECSYFDPKEVFCERELFPCEECYCWQKIEAGLAYSLSPCSNCGTLINFTNCSDPHSELRDEFYSPHESECSPRKQRKNKGSNSTKNTARKLTRPKANRQGLKRFLQSGRNPWLCSRRKDRQDWIAQLLIHWSPKIEDYLRRANRRAWFLGPILVQSLGSADLRISTSAFTALQSEAFHSSKGLSINLEKAAKSKDSRQVINALRLLQARKQCAPFVPRQRKIIREAQASRDVRARAEALSLLFRVGETVSMAGLEDLFDNSYNNELVLEFMTAAAFEPRRLKGNPVFCAFALKHQDPKIRLRAAALLGDSNFISIKSLPPLLEARGDPNREVNRTILKSIQQIASFVRGDTQSPVQSRTA
ncbi:MAG: hypothetical protein P1V97_01360 [Planctomycetota bacterium]|nr:hypothetical protein [Planctomycetota bacterium]